MPQPTGFILGFDPGGIGRFGWSVCRATNGTLQPLPKTGLANDAWDALNQVKSALGSAGTQGATQVLAAGIDAPMFWTKSGNRTVDDIVRQALKDHRFPTPGGTVQQINSLRGACLVQGILLGKHLTVEWPIEITEAHPRALHYLLRHSGQTEAMKMVQHLTEKLADHELDATLSAVAAWALLYKPPGWRNLYEEESGPVQPFDTSVSYWMPIP